MRFLTLCLAFSLTLAANALEKTFTWTPPTVYADGTPLPPTQIAGYTLSCGSLLVAIDGAVSTHKRDFAPGSYTCSLVTRATNGQVSLPSNSVNFTVPQPRPNAPTDFSVD